MLPVIHPIMRKNITLLLIVLVTISTSLTAQTFFEGFEAVANGSLPAGWTAIDQDGQTPSAATAFVGTSWSKTNDPTPVNPGNAVLSAAADFAPAGTADNWLFTPQITPASGDNLYWDARSRTGNSPEAYEVYVATAQTVASAQAGTLIFSTTAAPATLAQTTASLAGFAGQPVYIAFRQITTNGSILDIDDVMVATGIYQDIRVRGNASRYSQIHASQLTDLHFGLDVKNVGTQDNNQYSVLLEVIHNGSVVYTDTYVNVTGNGNTITLKPGDSFIYSFPSGAFTPQGMGTYDFVYTISTNLGDTNLTNNTDTISVNINQTTYARDNGSNDGDLAIGAGISGLIGTEYEIVNATQVIGITAGLANPNAANDGQSLTFELYDMLHGQPNNLIATTAPVTLSGTNSLYTAQFPAPVNLQPGSYVAVVNEPTAITSDVMYSDSIYTLGKSWIYFFGVWDIGFNYGLEGAYMVRLEFDPATLSADDIAAQKSAIRAYPNPVAHLLYINLEESSNFETLSIYDATGKLILEQRIEEASMEVNTESLAVGMYTAVLRGSGESQNIKFVVQR